MEDCWRALIGQHGQAEVATALCLGFDPKDPLGMLLGTALRNWLCACRSSSGLGAGLLRSGRYKNSVAVLGILLVFLLATKPTKTSLQPAVTLSQ